MHSPTSHCNEAVARNVTFEFRMFKYLGEYLEAEYSNSESGDEMDHTSHGAKPRNDIEAIGSAILESFLLHTRVIRDFFYAKGAKSDDILAKHFVEHWETIRPEIPRTLAENKERLDKALAHLSIARVAYELDDMKWNVSTFYCEIGELINLFLRNLPAERRGWFTEGD